VSAAQGFVLLAGPEVGIGGVSTETCPSGITRTASFPLTNWAEAVVVAITKAISAKN
jgi:ribosome modulation factor